MVVSTPSTPVKVRAGGGVVAREVVVAVVGGAVEGVVSGAGVVVVDPPAPHAATVKAVARASAVEVLGFMVVLFLRLFQLPTARSFAVVFGGSRSPGLRR